MQLNPSTDFYDEDEDYGYDNDKDDGIYDVYDDDSEKKPQHLPLAKGLVQNEETDMGYDEDDEQVAPKRAKELQNEDHTDFMNEESSGGWSTSSLQDNNRYKSGLHENRYRLDYLERSHKKQHKTIGETREGSGNFANDDDDDGSDEGDSDKDDDDDGDDTFFQSKRLSNTRYFRKNTNDAIKIISTPLGKVGIVYQQTTQPKKEEDGDSKLLAKTTFTDFDTLSPDPNSSRRFSSSHPKITPVLTADGKVALLYRGDSETTKYEPIRNLTHKFNNNIDNKTNASSINQGKLDSSDDDNSESVDSGNNYNDNDTHENDNENGFVSSSEDKHIPLTETTTTTLPSTFVIPDSGKSNSILPIINRPLSEVLGIRKNQFKQFRIKDVPTTAATTTDNVYLLTKVNLADFASSSRSRKFDFDFSQDTTMLDERNRHNQRVSGGQNAQSDTASRAAGKPDDDVSSESTETIASQDVLSRTEVVNLAIIPHFDEEFERQQRLREHENRRHHRQRHRHKHEDEDLSGIHCVMQAMMGIAAISTVFGMLGTFFKQRILDQIRIMHW